MKEMRIFISHSSQNAKEAEEVCRLLEEHGVRCFIAPRDIRMGREYAEEIVNGLDASSAMVLLMSEAANQSPHVLREVERAVSRSIPILVYKLEEVILSKSMEYFLMTHQWVSARERGGYEGILEFAADLERQVKSGCPGDTVTRTAAVGEAESQGAGTAAAGGSRRKKRRGLFAAAALLCLAALGAVFAGILLAGRTPGAIPVQVGDTVSFGSYNGEEIRWRVLRLSEDGTQAVLVAADILTMKAFDAAEGGRYNRYEAVDYWSRESAADTDMELQIMVRGNSDWSASNLRTWLNSAEEVVAYGDQPPMASAMAEKKNGYQNEAGFLYGFTQEERDAIVETSHETAGNALTAGTVATEDKVYLLSLEELEWFDQAGISKLAVPTRAAVEQDGSNWYAVDLAEYGIREYCWWLREPVEGTSSKCYLVGNGYTEENLRRENAGLEGYGVRPALTVELSFIGRGGTADRQSGGGKPPEKGDLPGGVG